MRWVSVIAGGLVLASCDFQGLFEKYCQDTGSCRCEGPDCCAEEGQSCADLPCCDGMACSGTCQGEVQLVFDPPSPVLITDGVSPSASATDQIRVTNQGQRQTHGFRILADSATREFSFDTSGCDGRELGSGQTCTFGAAFSPRSLGQQVANVRAATDTKVWTINVSGRAGRELRVDRKGWTVALLSTPPGIDCPDISCSAFFSRGSTASLQMADPDAGVEARFGPPCGTGVPCTVTMNEDVAISVEMVPFLTIDFAGLYGYVHLEPTGDVASYYGQRQFAVRGPTRLVLEGTAIMPWTEGPCAGQEPTCLLDVQSPLTVRVDFRDRLNEVDVVGPYPLTEIGANLDLLCSNNGIAWLFTSTHDPRPVLAASRGWAQDLLHPFLDQISDAERGRALLQLHSQINGPLVSGLRPDGSLPRPQDVCNDFRSTSGTTVPGTSELGGSAWFLDPAATPLPCSGEASVVCFSPGPPVRPIAPYGPRRVGFLSEPWIPLGGVGAADAFCQNQASRAGLAGAFRALLNRTGDSPGERFAHPQGPPWSTPVGNAVPLPGYPGAFPEGPYVNIAADGGVIRSTGAVDTGTLVWSDQFSTDDADTCLSWMGGTGTSGRVRRPEESVPTNRRISCATAQRLLCFED